MARNELNYLREVRNSQKLAQKKLDTYAYISFKEIWKLLRKEELFFKNYNTFLRHMNESQVNTRITELEKEEL